MSKSKKSSKDKAEALIDEYKELTKLENEEGKTSAYVEGSLMYIGESKGHQEFGSILKVIKNKDLREYDKDLPKEIDQDFDIIGTYHLGELSICVTFNKEFPKMIVITAIIISDDKCEFLEHCKDIDQEVKDQINKDLIEIAKTDPEVESRSDDLLRLSLLSCMNQEMSKMFKVELTGEG